MDDELGLGYKFMQPETPLAPAVDGQSFQYLGITESFILSPLTLHTLNASLT